MAATGPILSAMHVIGVFNSAYIFPALAAGPTEFASHRPGLDIGCLEFLHRSFSSGVSLGLGG